MDLAAGHDIIRNGYDLGRDAIVAAAVFGNDSNTIPTLAHTNETTYSGSSSYNK
jgi:hypothetical protein